MKKIKPGIPTVKSPIPKQREESSFFLRRGLKLPHLSKRYIWIIIMTSVIFSACENGGNTSTVLEEEKNPSAAAEVSDFNNKPVEISVVTSYGVDDGNRQNYEKAYKAYEAETGNTVRDNSGISNEEWKLNIMSSFSVHNEPDVLFFFTGADANKIISDERVVSIDEIRSIYPDYASNMQDEYIPKSLVDGKAYAVPVNGYWEGLYVNKKVLNECGVDIPDRTTTWAEFLSDCQKISDNGYIPIAASLNEVPHYWFEFCVLNNGNIEKHTSLPQSSTDEIGKSWVMGFNDMRTLYELGFFPDNTTTALTGETDFLMIENKAAFMIEGSWKMGWFAENAGDINDFTVTYVPGKGARKSTDIIGGLSMGYYITKKAWDNPLKQAACVEFVKSMTRDEVVASFGVTAVNALKENIPLPPNSSSIVEAALDMSENFTYMIPASADNLSSDSRSILVSNVKNIVTGKITAEKVIDLCLEVNNKIA